MSSDYYCSFVECDHDCVTGEALRRGWCHKRGHAARLLRPKRGKAAVRAHVQGQGWEVFRGRNVFKRCARTETWCRYLAGSGKCQSSRGSAVRKSGKEVVDTSRKARGTAKGAVPAPKALCADEVNEALSDAISQLQGNETACKRAAGDNAQNDTRLWDLAVARAEHTAELYASHVQSQPMLAPAMQRQQACRKSPCSVKERKRDIEYRRLHRLHEAAAEQRQLLRNEQMERQRGQAQWQHHYYKDMELRRRQADLALALQLRQQPDRRGLRELRRLGIPTPRGAGFSARELHATGFSMQNIRSGGFTAQELLDECGFSTMQLFEAGYGAGELRQAGFEVGQLLCRFSAADVHNAGFSASELRSAGLTARQLRLVGISAAQLRFAGFTALQLVKGGFSISQLQFPVCSAAELQDVAVQLRMEGCCPGQLLASGFTAEQLRDAGFCALQLQSVRSLDEFADVFELGILQICCPEADGQVATGSCTSLGGLEVAAARVGLDTNLCELLQALEQAARKSFIFLLPNGRIASPHDAAQPLAKFLD